MNKIEKEVIIVKILNILFMFMMGLFFSDQSLWAMNQNFSSMDSAPLQMIDFWAPWCSPCRRLSPVVDSIAQNYRGKITVTKVNIDEQPYLAEQFEVRELPTLIFLKAGQVVQRFSGMQSQATLNWVIQQYLY